MIGFVNVKKNLKNLKFKENLKDKTFFSDIVSLSLLNLSFKTWE